MKCLNWEIRHESILFSQSEIVCLKKIIKRKISFLKIRYINYLLNDSGGRSVLSYAQGQSRDWLWAANNGLIVPQDRNQLLRHKSDWYSNGCPGPSISAAGLFPCLYVCVCVCVSQEGILAKKVAH